jgi:hypothetical protein
MKTTFKSILFTALGLAASSSQAQILSPKIIAEDAPVLSNPGPIYATAYASTNGTASVGWMLMLGMWSPPPVGTGLSTQYQQSTYQLYWQTPSPATPPATCYLHLAGNAQAVGLIGPTGASLGEVSMGGSGTPNSTLDLSYEQVTQPVARFGGEYTMTSGSPAASARIAISMTWTLISTPGSYPATYKSQEISFTSPTLVNQVNTSTGSGTVTYKAWASYSIAIQFLTY